MSSFININGKLLPANEASIVHDNRAFRYGYGLFETMRMVNGEIALKEYHWKRLFAGMKTLYFDVHKLFTSAFLEEQILKTVKRNLLESLSRVRLQVYAGTGGLFDAKDQQPNFIIECFPLSPTILDWNENGLILGIAEGLQKSADTLANFKTTNALIYAMAAQISKGQKWNDALILNTNNHIIESIIANIFWIKNTIIYTPQLSEGCVAGIMRHHILETLPSKGFELKETILTKEILQHADEVFLTNTIRGIKWVKRIGDTFYSNEITSKIFRANQ